MQCICTASDPDSMLDTQIVGELLFESGDLVTENIHSAVQYPVDCLIDLTPMRPVIRGRIRRKDHLEFILSMTFSYVLLQVVSIEFHGTDERLAQRHPRLPVQEGPDSTEVREVIAD